MREAVAFYRRWFTVAFHGMLDKTALLAFLVLALADGFKHYFPALRPVTDSIAWSVPFWALATVLTVRILTAPFTMWSDDQARLAALEINRDIRNAAALNGRDLHELADRAGIGRSFGTELRKGVRLAEYVQVTGLPH